LRYQALEDLKTKLRLLGVKVADEAERIEEWIERCNTPELVTSVGMVLSVLASDEAAGLMQEVMPPEVLVDYVEGEQEQVEVDGETTLVDIPWPEYTVTTQTESGSVTTTQGAGRFQI